jgi:hypothetical protein
MSAIGLAVLLATALGPPGSQSAEAAEKGAFPKKAAVVKYQMFRPDGTPVRSKGQKGGGQNAMVLQDSSGTTKSSRGVRSRDTLIHRWQR